MRTLQSLQQQEMKLRAEHTVAAKNGNWLTAQTIRRKLIDLLNVRFPL
jgi:hypothetical protein